MLDDIFYQLTLDDTGTYICNSWRICEKIQSKSVALAQNAFKRLWSLVFLSIPKEKKIEYKRWYFGNKYSDIAYIPGKLSPEVIKNTKTLRNGEVITQGT